MTKDQQIKSLKTRLETGKSKYDEVMAANRSLSISLGDVRAEVAQLQDEVAAANTINTRQSKTVAILNEKIGKLKEVARFFRAQRDRVDAYLSGVLDQVDPVEPEKAEDRYGPSMASIDHFGTRSTAAPRPNRRRRPGVPEPFVSPRLERGSEIDGRNELEGYRDYKPEDTEGWENF